MLLATDQAIHSSSLAAVVITKVACRTTTMATTSRTFPFDYSCYIRVAAWHCWRRSPSMVVAEASTSWAVAGRTYPSVTARVVPSCSYQAAITFP